MVLLGSWSGRPYVCRKEGLGHCTLGDATPAIKCPAPVFVGVCKAAYHWVQYQAVDLCNRPQLLDSLIIWRKACPQIILAL